MPLKGSGHLDPVVQKVERFVNFDLQKPLVRSLDSSVCPCEQPPAKGSQRVRLATYCVGLLGDDVKNRIEILDDDTGWSSDKVESSEVSANRHFVSYR